MASNDFEKYEVVEVQRSDLKNAPYNPRALSDRARKKLKANIARVGLLEPPVWNATTGNIVSGHQRVSILDALNRKKDYKIRVARVELDEKTEIEQNIFFNNPEAQGEYELERLEEIMREKIEIENTGFDTADIMNLLGESPLIAQPERLTELSEKLRAETKKYEGVAKNLGDRDDTGYYAVVVCKSRADRDRLAAHLDYPEGTVYINGETLADALGVPPF